MASSKEVTKIIYPAGIASDENTGNYMIITSKLLDQKDSIESAKNAMDATAEHIVTAITGQIILPLPNSLQDSTAHNWEVAEGLTQEASGIAGSALETFTNKLGSNGANVNSGIIKLARKAGFNIDPKYWQMYNGTMPREFSFDWTFVPESSLDAENLIKMLQFLKYSASPGQRGGLASLLLDSPNVFSISFSNQILQQTIRMKDAVCTHISIDYMGQGYSDFYHDGRPKQVKLSMTFAERHTLYKEDYEGEMTSSGSGLETNYATNIKK